MGDQNNSQKKQKEQSGSMGDNHQQWLEASFQPITYLAQNREFRKKKRKKKHEIAQVTAQLQAHVKVANLSRKHKNEMFK